jgi:hypothetical protein
MSKVIDWFNKKKSARDSERKSERDVRSTDLEESALLDELRRRRTRRKNSEIRRVTVASIPAERYVVATAVLLRAVSLCRSGLRAKLWPLFFI